MVPGNHVWLWLAMAMAAVCQSVEMYGRRVITAVYNSYCLSVHGLCDIAGDSKHVELCGVCTRMSPGYMYPGRATCIRIHVDGYKLLVRDTCGLYLGDIVTIHLCHGRLVSLCIQQQTGDKLATFFFRRCKIHVDGDNWIQLVSGNMCPGVNAALDIYHSSLHYINSHAPFFGLRSPKRQNSAIKAIPQSVTLTTV